MPTSTRMRGAGDRPRRTGTRRVGRDNLPTVDPEPTPVEPIEPARPIEPLTPPEAPPDLDLVVAADLAAVEQALTRLDDGTYWTDEVTGEPLSPDLLAEHPTARRNPAPS